MKKGWFNSLLPHLIAFLIFLVVAVIYCKPVLEGKVLQQHDVTQWKAMAQNSFDYKEEHGKFPLWTNSMFSGMPAYQIAIESSIKVSPLVFYHILSLGLPKPISFFFLACICFYFLCMVLRTGSVIGVIGSLAFAYVTYNPIIVAAGHDTKMQTIALMPAFIASLLLLYERKYWVGGALTALFTALLVGMNHPQIAYYSFIIAFFMTIGYAVYWIRQKDFRHLLTTMGIVVVAGIAGVLTNAVPLFTTFEYAKASIRGGSELATAGSNSTREGLSDDYALSYSMAKAEPFVMMVPNMFGGASEPIESFTEESQGLQALQSMPQEISNQIAGARLAYWGGINPTTSGPPYVGAIICFLALIGFFLLNNKHKWWILATMVLAIIMSWGSYFLGFNTFLLNHLPMYNKFRAPSMIIVIPTFLLCMMAVLTLKQVVNYENKTELWERYKKGLILTGAMIAIILLIYMSVDFTSEYDRQLLNQVNESPEQVKGYIRNFVNGLKEDRKSIFISSLMRSLFFMAAAALMIWLSIRKKIQSSIVLGVIGVLAFIDVMAVNSKYLNSENYQDEMEYENNFVASATDRQIMQDTSYYRVFDLRQGLGTLTYGAMTANYHNSIGGYHPAKLSIYQDLIEHQLSKFPQSLPVVNMLNTKYVIQADQQGKEQLISNPENLGAAWFVQGIRYENGAKAVMDALGNFNPRDTALVFAEVQNQVQNVQPAPPGSTIQLLFNDNDVAVYRSNATTNSFGVFSEVYYPNGWTAYVDGKEAQIIRTNYVLRGLVIPAGQHEIRFEFKPASFYTGEIVAFIAGLLIFIALFAAAFMEYRRRKRLSKNINKH
jgi:hypothetical protein